MNPANDEWLRGISRPYAEKLTGELLGDFTIQANNNSP